eukprot:361475-Chlamydomonas_euryale.AAC.4
MECAVAAPSAATLPCCECSLCCHSTAMWLNLLLPRHCAVASPFAATPHAVAAPSARLPRCARRYVRRGRVLRGGGGRASHASRVGAG